MLFITRYEKWLFIGLTHLNDLLLIRRQIAIYSTMWQTWLRLWLFLSFYLISWEYLKSRKKMECWERRSCQRCPFWWFTLWITPADWFTLTWVTPFCFFRFRKKVESRRKEKGLVPEETGIGRMLMLILRTALAQWLWNKTWSNDTLNIFSHVWLMARS